MSEDKSIQGWIDYHDMNETNRREPTKVHPMKSSLEPDAIDLSMYELPKGTLTGEEPENAVRTLHYNNVDFKDYRAFLEGWIAYYELSSQNPFMQNSYDNTTLEEYKAELARIVQEEGTHEKP